MSFIAKLLTKGANKVLSKADKKKLADKAKEAAELKKNQKKPANTLQSKSKTEQKESGMGTESKTRITSGERGKAMAGAKREYKTTLKKLDTDPNLSDEQMDIMLGKLKDLEKRYGPSVKADADMNKGGMPTKKAIGPTDYRKGGMVLSTVDNRRNK